MSSFSISFRMVCNGTVTVNANDLAAAKKKVEDMSLSQLGAEAEDGEVEFVEEECL